jgi:hypothetical protein
LAKGRVNSFRYCLGAIQEAAEASGFSGLLEGLCGFASERNVVVVQKEGPGLEKGRPAPVNNLKGMAGRDWRNPGLVNNPTRGKTRTLHHTEAATRKSRCRSCDGNVLRSNLYSAAVGIALTIAVCGTPACANVRDVPAIRPAARDQRRSGGVGGWWTPGASGIVTTDRGSSGRSGYSFVPNAF